MAAIDFQTAVESIVANAPINDLYLHGDASTDVPTRNGPVPSIAKQKAQQVVALEVATAEATYLAAAYANPRESMSEGTHDGSIVNGGHFSAPTPGGWQAFKKVSSESAVALGSPIPTTSVLLTSLAAVQASANQAALARAAAEAAAANVLAGPEFARFLGATGLDSNPGLKPWAPWRTWTNVNAAGTAITGLPVGVERGSSYGQTIITAPAFRMGSYGSSLLPRPKFDPRVPLTGWTATAGHPNVWQVSITTDGDPKRKGNAFLNNTLPLQVASLAALDAAPNGSYFVPSWTDVNTLVYVKSAANPDTDGSLWTMATLTSTGLVVNGDNWFVAGITAYGAAHQDGTVRMIGRNGTMINCEIMDGARHAAYFQPNPYLFGNKFGRCRNDLEGSSNTVVINATSSPGEGFTSRNNIYTGTGGYQVTGPLQHDGVSSTLMGQQLSYDDQFIDLISWFSISGTDMRAERPVFSNVTGGAAISVAGFKATVTDGTGTLDQFYNATVGGTVISARGNYLCRLLGTGYWRLNTSTTDLSLNITGDKLTIADGVASTSNPQVIRHARGPVNVSGLNVTLPNDEPLCAPFRDLLAAGLSANTTYTASNNVYPFGVRFILNGVTYPNLAAFQAAGYEAGSTVRVPVATASDDLSGADGNVSARAGWSLVDGVATTLQKVGTNIGAVATTKAFNKFGEGDWVTFVVGAAPAAAGPGIALGAVDQNNIKALLRWTNSTWQVGRVINGSYVVSVVGSNEIVPAAGQVVHFALKGDKVWLYVDGKMIIQGGTMAATALGSARGVGILTQSVVVNPFISTYFQRGVINA